MKGPPPHPRSRSANTIRSLQRSQQRPDRPGEAAQRIKAREAGEQAHREAMERFAPITAENFNECAAWQDARMRELTR